MKQYKIKVKAKDYNHETVEYEEYYEAISEMEVRTKAYDHGRTMMLHRIEIIEVKRIG